MKRSELDGNLVEQVAETIFLSRVSDAEHEAMGTMRRLWKTDRPWDSQPDVELCEWERDDYRSQARAVLLRLHELGQLVG